MAVQYQGAYANSPANYVLLPECIWSAGFFGGTWSTEVQTHGPVGRIGDNGLFRLRRRAPARPDRGLDQRGRAGASLKLSNILSSLGSVDTSFTYYGKVGTVEFQTQDSSHQIQVAARTLNGNCSKTFPGLRPADGNTASTARQMIIENLTNNATYRSTCGFFNPTANSVRCRVPAL